MAYPISGPSDRADQDTEISSTTNMIQNIARGNEFFDEISTAMRSMFQVGENTSRMENSFLHSTEYVSNFRNPIVGDIINNAAAEPNNRAEENCGADDKLQHTDQMLVSSSQPHICFHCGRDASSHQSRGNSEVTPQQPLFEIQSRVSNSHNIYRPRIPNQQFIEESIPQQEVFNIYNWLLRSGVPSVPYYILEGHQQLPVYNYQLPQYVGVNPYEPYIDEDEDTMTADSSETESAFSQDEEEDLDMSRDGHFVVHPLQFVRNPLVQAGPSLQSSTTTYGASSTYVEFQSTRF